MPLAGGSYYRDGRDDDMLTTSLDAVDEQLLGRVCAERWPEGQELEFKAELPPATPDGRRELVKDALAMANADGGDIVFGIAEDNGQAVAIAPITGEPADSAMARIRQTLESGTEPRIRGLQIKVVTHGSGYVLVLRVQASFHGPHCQVINGNLRRFVMRTGGNTSDLTFDQLRNAFDRTASLGEAARSFIKKRLVAINDLETPKPLVNAAIGILHLVPLSGLARKQTFDLHRLHAQDYMALFPRDWGFGLRDFNIDGVVAYPPSRNDKDHDAYCQVFRDGAVEFAFMVGRAYREAPGGPLFFEVPGEALSRFFHGRTDALLRLARDHGLSGPAVLSFCLWRVDGHELGIGDSFFRNRRHVPDRQMLVTPEAWIESIESAKCDEVTRPLLDVLWQGFGMERCIHFDSQTGSFGLPAR